MRSFWFFRVYISTFFAALIVLGSTAFVGYKCISQIDKANKLKNTAAEKYEYIPSSSEGISFLLICKNSLENSHRKSQSFSHVFQQSQSVSSLPVLFHTTAQRSFQQEQSSSQQLSSTTFLDMHVDSVLARHFDSTQQRQRLSLQKSACRIPVLQLPLQEQLSRDLQWQQYREQSSAYGTTSQALFLQTSTTGGMTAKKPLLKKKLNSWFQQISME